MRDIMRTLVTLEDRQVEKLDAMARRRGVSRAALVREAVDRLVETDELDAIHASAGLWKDRTDIVDGLEYQLAIRAEWDHRP
jgi:predicted transcriptional regulator